MTGADLFEGFGGLEDDLLIRSRKKGRLEGQSQKIWKYGGMAACLMILMGVAVTFRGWREPWWGQDAQESDATVKDDEHPLNALGETLENANATGGREEKEAIITEVEKELARPLNSEDLRTLLALDGAKLEMAAKAYTVSVGGHRADYMGIATSDKAKATLLEHAGEVVADSEEGYQLRKLMGHEDLQYLVSVREAENGEMAGLLKFEQFEEMDYSYREVLETIYHVHGAEDIVKVVVSPASMDNTDEGRAIQEEIGTRFIEEDAMITEIWQMLCGLQREGGKTWEDLGLFEEEGDSVSLREQVRMGRYLTLVTADGMEIDTLKYTGISGRFYEYGGIVYDGLNPEQAKRMEELLGIDGSENMVGLKDNAGAGKQEGRGMTDIPVDEDNYREARNYDAELEELQEKISEAMMNHELPFVTTSGIRENPDRLHVTVNTRDEAELARLKAYDMAGKWLEIEYNEGQAMWE